MKRLLLLDALALSTTLSVSAHEPNGSHEMCLSAADYAGCFKVHSKTDQLDGNACPQGYAFVGDKTCREVECRYLAYRAPHSALLAGKAWKCKSQNLTRMKLIPGMRVGMIYDSKCPEGTPEIGWNSTCDHPYEEPPKTDRVEGRRRELEG